ncbi:MAG: hypothetical protein R3B35_12370 [Gemmatimonadales bacterium]
MTDPNDLPAAGSIPNHLAQQVIARAIQLDSDRATSMPIGRLREIAHEAGISADAVQRALLEVAGQDVVAPARTARPQGYLRRLWRRLRHGPAAVDPESEPDPWTLRGAAEFVATNVLAFLAFWLPTFVILVALRRLGLLESDMLDLAAVVASIFAGAALAWRLRARLTFAILALSGIAASAGLLSELAGSTPQGGFLGSSAFTWILAAGFGTVFGILLGRQSAARSGSGGTAGTQPTLLSIMPESTRRPPDAPPEETPFLRLRLREM